MNIQNIKNPKAFLGKITSQVRYQAEGLYMFSNQRTLDLCCGNGLFFLQQKTQQNSAIRYGLDYSLPLLQEAQEIYSDNGIQDMKLIAGNAFATPIKDNSFDTIYCLNTLINFKSENQINSLFKELKRICINNGRIIFDIRNSANLFLKILYWRHQKQNSFPVKAYRLNYVKKIISEHGFTLEKIIPIEFPFRLFCWAYILIFTKNEQKE